MDIMKKQSKEKRFTWVIRIIITICFWACLFAAVLCGVLGIIFILFPDAYEFLMKPLGLFTNLPSAVNAKETAGIELSDMLIYKDRLANLSLPDLKPVYEILIFKAAVSQALLALFLYQLVKVLNTIKNALPFTVKNSARITFMGILLMIYSIAVRAGDYFMLKLTLDRIAVPELALKFSFDTGGMLVGLLLILLAGIFKYGGYLQEEYDTTL